MQDILASMEQDINRELDTLLPEPEGRLSHIYESIRYSMLAGGKRIRPILTLLTYEAVGGTEDVVYPFACAVEMIHTYSLIHDDLPAIDNDDLRRGIATNHIKFDEWTAILTGDALLNLAFETMLGATMQSPQRSYIEAMDILAEKSGTKGMLGGQVIDILSEDLEIDANTVNFINENKTAALIIASTEIGAVLGGASEKVRDALVAYARNLGVAFQIADDILDVTSSDEELGKPVNSDIKNNKSNYISIYGIKESRKLLEQLTNNAISELEQIEIKDTKLKKLALFLTARIY